MPRLPQLGAALQRLLDLAFVEPCASCRSVDMTAAALFCPTCLAAAGVCTEPRRIGEVPCFAPFPYSEPVRQALHCFKFEGGSHLARRLGAALSPVIAGLAGFPGLAVVPVPAHTARLAERGYNPAGLLAGAAAAGLGLPCLYHRLRRRGPARQQSRLGRVERTALDAQSFTFHGQRPQLPLVLVDDVLTTGSTASACIERLRLAGCDVAAVVTLAQAGYD